MTKPKVFEIEAMDESDWEREWGAGHETPEANAEGVATLVRQTAQEETVVGRKTANVAATIPRSSVPAMATVTPRATPLPMRAQPSRRMPLPAPNEVPIMAPPPLPGVAPVPGLGPLPGLPPQRVLEIDAELPQAMHMPRMTSAAEHIERRADATPNRVPGTLDAIDAEVKLSSRPSKRVLAIAGGVLAVGALVIVFAMTRGSGDDKTPAAAQPAAASAPGPAAASAKTDTKSDSKLDETIAKTDESIRQGNAVVNDEAEPAKPEPPAKPAPVVKAQPAIAKPAPVAKAKPAPVAKPVAKASPKPEPVAKAKPRPVSAPIAASSARPASRPATKPAAKRVAAATPPANDLDGARAAYGDGNQALFAGNAEDAIRAYQRALASSATYASGYRGLGLAYAEKGDNASAIKALRKYLELAPRARDAVLVQKRIEMLRQSPARSRSAR